MNRVRFLTLVASVALWCGSSLNAHEEVLGEDLNGINLTDGASDGYWYAGLQNWLAPGPFCADPANIALPQCLTALEYPWFAGFGYAGAWSGWPCGYTGWGFDSFGYGGGWGGYGGRGGRGGRGRR